MNLKKSDKIIAIVGVVILVLAGIGIYVASQGEPEEKEEEPIEETNFYTVTNEEKTVSTSPDNTDYLVKNKILKKRSQPYLGTLNLTQDNLKNVEFTVEYQDSISGMLFGLLKKAGRDTLTIEIMDEDNEVIEKQQITGSGNTTITVPIGDAIQMGEIEAESREEAESILEEEYFTYDKTYNVRVSINVKEGFLRPIALLREVMKNDQFDLNVEYTYFDYSLMEEETGGDNVEDDETSLSTNRDKSIYKSEAFNNMVTTGSL
ncbi:MAG: hypothetical protein V5A64_03065 [Candidatus Thermoplasmatota archaeon]